MTIWEYLFLTIAHVAGIGITAAFTIGFAHLCGGYVYHVVHPDWFRSWWNDLASALGTGSIAIVAVTAFAFAVGSLVYLNYYFFTGATG
jgi:hypothetical protein